MRASHDDTTPDHVAEAIACGCRVAEFPTTLEAAEAAGAIVFQAGTGRRADGVLTAQGGRVLNVTALGANVTEAQARAYDAVGRIDWPEGFCRRDIGDRALRLPPSGPPV